MVNKLLSPPIVYYLVLLIVLLSILIYWKRVWIKKELQRWRAKEISAGPIKFEREIKDTTARKLGVHIGSKGDFSGAQIRNIAGRDIIESEEILSNNTGAIPGVEISGGKYKDANIGNIAGRDIQRSQEPDESNGTDMKGDSL